MSRRGEGSIRQKPNGSWEARYTAWEHGVYQRRSVSGKTRQEAAQRLRAALEARDRGIVATPARETLSAYLTAWLEGSRLSVRRRTHKSYTQIVRDYIAPNLGRIRLDRLQPQQIRQLYARLTDQDLSSKTVRNVHQCLHRALEQAVSDRVLASNPAHAVKPPRVERGEMMYLTPEQARQVLDEARSDVFEALWVVALTTGLRQGELLALRWPQVDLDRGRVQVVAALEGQTRAEARLAEVKTRRSRRQVELGAAAVEALGLHRAKQVEAGILPTGFVFARADGTHMMGYQVYDRWTRLRARAGVPDMPFHSLRHTAATLLLIRGVHPKVVSEMLGHASVAITLDRYSHVIPTMHREAARVMDELLAGE